MSRCPSCGRPLPAHQRDVRYRLPDPVLTSELQDRAPGVWQTAHDATESVMMLVPAIGAFVRALLPVTLTGGYTLRFGVWIAVTVDDLHRAFEVWWKPEYNSLRLDGLVANRIQPWGVLGRPVGLTVLDPDQTPYCTSSDDPDLHRVLTGAWPHDPVLAVLPSLGPV